MKPPYEINSKILTLVSSISENLGSISAYFLDKPTTTLRKQNKIKTIHSSLKIEGNTLTENQITALLENKRVVGPENDIKEVLNALQIYNQLKKFNYKSEKSFLKAHKILLKNINNEAGKYRKQGVGIVKGNKVEHLAPPFENVPFLMKDLFTYLESEEIILIKSCVFHYEMEFIHPFIDGNGRMGRLWQTLILMHKYPVFEYLPFETLISDNQEAYYKALSESDKAGNSTKFIEFMLDIINESLDISLKLSTKKMNSNERIDYFLETNRNEFKKGFSRKDYLKLFKQISSATASRDLQKAVDLKLIIKTGDKNKTLYLIIKT